MMHYFSEEEIIMRAWRIVIDAVVLIFILQVSTTNFLSTVLGHRDFDDFKNYRNARHFFASG